MRSLFVSLLASCGVALLLGGCAADTGADAEAPAPAEKTAEHADDLGIGSGGGLGFQCTSGVATTTCSCTVGADASSPQGCHDMDTSCHNHGSTVTCTYPPNAPATCTCSWAGLPRVAVKAGSGNVVAPPSGAVVP